MHITRPGNAMAPGDGVFSRRALFFSSVAAADDPLTVVESELHDFHQISYQLMRTDELVLYGHDFNDIMT